MSRLDHLEVLRVRPEVGICGNPDDRLKIGHKSLSRFQRRPSASWGETDIFEYRGIVTNSAITIVRHIPWQFAYARFWI